MRLVVLRAHGASNFLCDPEIDAATGPAFWRSSVNPGVVVFRMAPGHSFNLRGRQILAETADRQTRFLVLAGSKARHRVRIEIDDLAAANAYELNADAGLEVRLAAVRAFHFPGRTVAPSARNHLLCPSAYQRHRLAMLLTILDRLDAKRASGGVTLRQIADELLSPGIAKLSALEWKSSSQRRQVQRLVAEAREMSANGFRDLVRSGSRTPRRQRNWGYND